MKNLTIKLVVILAIFLFVATLVKRNDIDLSLFGSVSEKVGETVSEAVKDTTINEVTEKLQEQEEEKTGIVFSADNNFEEFNLVRVVDGDTVIVKKNDGPEIYVRLIGIDTPESVNPDETKNNEYGELASQYTKLLLKDQTTLWLQYDKELYDQYGRTLAYVWLTDKVDSSDYNDIEKYMLNGNLISQGYAINKVYEPNTLNASAFEKIKNKAKKNNAGLWAYSDIGWQ